MITRRSAADHASNRGRRAYFGTALATSFRWRNLERQKKEPAFAGSPMRKISEILAPSLIERGYAQVGPASIDIALEVHPILG